MKQLSWDAVLRHRRLIIGSVLVSVAWAAQAGIMGDIDGQFRPMQAQWFAALKGAAISLFWMLAAIDFAWHSAAQVMETGEVDAVLKGVMKRIFRYGMFFALLKFSDTWLPAIISSFRELGARAAGTGAVTPDAIVDLGVNTTLDIMSAIGSKGLVETLVLGLPLMFLGLVTYVCFLFVALQVLITQIEIYIVCGAGVVILGFGGSVWTKDMAVNLYKYAIQVGVKLLILMLVVGIGMSIAQALVISPENLLKSTLTTFGSALIFAYLAVKAPALANGMLTGSGSLSAGDMAGTAVAAVAGTAAAAAGGAAVAGMAANAGGNVLAGAGGIAQAMGAGLNSAADHGKSGADALMHAGKEVAAHGLSMAGAVTSQALGGTTASFGERVAESTGGKIAQSIESSRGGSIGSSGGAAQSASGAAPNASGTAASGGTPTTGPAPTPGGTGASGGAPASSGGSASGGTPASGGGSSASGATPPSGGSQTSGVTPASGAAPASDDRTSSRELGSEGASPAAAPLSEAVGLADAAPPMANAATAGDRVPQGTPLGASTASQGSAAGASVEAGEPQGTVGSPGASAGGDGRKLHDRILSQRDFLPEDAVMAGATAQIDTNARGE